MNLVDLLIGILFVGSLVRGAQTGSVRQVLSTGGFFAGLFLGAWIEPHLVRFVHTDLSRSLMAIGLTLGLGLVGLSAMEYLGARLKHRLERYRLDRLDVVLGSIVGGLTLLLTVWLTAAIVITLPFFNFQNDVRGSWIISQLDKTLPPAPRIVADLGHLISPNGFPKVFSGQEPTPTPVALPSLASLQTAINQDSPSVVKIEGNGCGGIIEGSGFVAAPGLIATNAHVVAGVGRPFVLAQNSRFSTSVVFFDPNLDFAVLRVNGLNAPVLTLNAHSISRGTPAAVLGYPGGGDFNAQPAAVLDEFMATGSNIYDQGAPARDIYEIQAKVIPGNSGGPLITSNGSVIGIVFAQSTTYDNVGYALTLSKVSSELKQAENQNVPVSTGSCAQQ